MSIDSQLQFQLFQESDSDTLAHWLASDTWPFHGTASPSKERISSSIAEGFYTGPDNQTFWIRLESEKQPIGLVCLHELTDLTPIFDLRFKQAFRNCGFGRQALPWLAHYLFTQTDKHRLEGHTRIDNVAMQRVFNACGWVKEAHYRQAWPDGSGHYFDALTYAHLKSDWATGTVTPVDWGIGH